MSGMLHPEGPEPAQTYWLRRVLVLLALLVLILVSIGVAGASMGATRKDNSTAVPTGDPTAADPTGPSSSTSASPSVSASPGTAKSPSPSASSSSSTGGTGTAAVVPACDRKDLKTTLSGKQMLKLGQPATFTIRLVNDGDAACRLVLTRSVFELKVTTGKQLLWSSRSCTTATFVIAGKLELDQSISWPMVWDGRATSAGCTVPGTVLKRGTYLVTATVTDSKKSELPVTLRA